MQILLALMIAIHANTSDIGYLVVETTQNEIKVLKTQEKALVDSVGCAYHVNTSELLKNSNYFEVRTENSNLYVEVKRVVKKKGKLKYKKL